MHSGYLERHSLAVCCHIGFVRCLETGLSYSETAATCSVIGLLTTTWFCFNKLTNSGNSRFHDPVSVSDLLGSIFAVTQDVTQLISGIRFISDHTFAYLIVL